MFKIFLYYVPYSKKFRLLINVLLIITSLLALFPQRSQARVYTKEHPLVIVGDWEYPPYEYLGEDGKPEGFNVDILNAVIGNMNVPYKIELKEWSDVLKSIENGTADIACAMHTNDQEKKYHFSKNAFTYCYFAVAYRFGTKPIHKLEDLKDRKIFVKNRDIAYNVLVDSGYAKNIIVVTDFKNMLKEMNKGNGDIAIWGRYPIHHLIYKYNFSNIDLADVTLPPVEYHFISEDTLLLKRVDDAYDSMKEKGELDAIYNKWFNTVPDKSLPVIFYYIIGALVIALLILYVFATMLRYRIKKASFTIINKDKRISLALNAGNVNIIELNTRTMVFHCVEGDTLPVKEFNYDTCKQAIQPDDYVKFDNAIQQLTAGNIKEASMTIRQKIKGNEDWLYIQASLAVDTSGSFEDKTLICTFKDITNDVLKQEEEKALLEKYAIVFNSTSVGLLYYDNNGILLDINDKACKMFGTSKEIIMANKLSVNDRIFTNELLRHKDDVPFYGTIRIDFNQFKKYAPFAKREGICYFETQVTTLYDKNDRIQSVIETLIDVTELRETSRMLAQSMKDLKKESEKAQQADKLKSIFLANMSHEIRTPLNAIVGFSGLIDSADNAQDRSEFIKIINRNSEQLLRLINDILDLSRLDADIIKINPQNIDFAIVYNETCETLKQRVQNPDVKFIFENPYESCKTCIDYNRIAQVITNFVINASKYTKSGYIKVGYAYENEGLRIFCEDTGTGIPKDKCDSIFDRFVKLNEFIPGTGLGLSICKAIADHCGGKIGVVSEEGKGSTFWVWIPCHAEIQKADHSTI